MPDETVPPPEDEPVIVVTGSKLIRVDGEADMPYWDWSWVGSTFSASLDEWYEGAGSATIETRESIADDVQMIIKFKEFAITATVSKEFWEALSSTQKAAFVHLMENYTKSETLMAALSHLDSEGVKTIEFRADTVAHNWDGSTTPFSSGDAAAISYDWAKGDPTFKDINPDTKAVITWNMGYGGKGDPNLFAWAMIHELLHPFVANGQSNSFDGDHGEAIDIPTRQIFVDIFGRDSQGNLVNIYDMFEGVTVDGTETIGSYNSDNLNGSTGNEILAGMAGDDYIVGGGGNDALHGGAGSDTLVAGLGSTYLYGGVGDDTYVASGPGSNLAIEDTSGYDRLFLSGNMSDYSFERVDDDLLIWSDSTQSAVKISGHYATDAIDEFAFADRSMSRNGLDTFMAGFPSPWEPVYPQPDW